VPTTKAVNEYIINTTGFSPVFCVENMRSDGVRSDGVHPEEKNPSILPRF
jgi:hypothetical protein